MDKTIPTMHTVKKEVLVYVDSNGGAKNYSVARGQATRYIKKNFEGKIEAHGLGDADEKTYIFKFIVLN